MEEKKSESKSDESEHESEEDESEILEESPCGRWLKRSEEVSQRNVPGIDRAYLAMDSEEGVEVVWNEVQFSERKSFKQQEEKIKAVFDNLMKIDHANIVKFHRYWIDYSKEQNQKTRVVFITEYMSSGSVKEFLNKTKDIQKYKRTKSWKRWCTQILSALSYLHSCTPPVIHGNMTCDTIFIQHNGLVKIGSVAPDAIRNHVKTYHEIKRNMHYYAPEYGAGHGITEAVDIYSFGICALEMAVPRTHLHYRESKSVTEADVERAIEILEDPNQRDFIRLCLRTDPSKRPSARSLLLHPLLFEVHSLKLLAAHAFVKNQRILPEYKQKEVEKESVVAEILSASMPKAVKLKDVPAFDVDKFLEDVKNGVYPLTSFALPRPSWTVNNSSQPSQSKGQSPEGQSSGDQIEDTPETRKIIYAQGTISPADKSYGLILQLRFEDKMNRHLNCEVLHDETAETLTSELVQHHLIKEADKDMIKSLLEDGLKSVKGSKTIVNFSTDKSYSNDSVEDIAAVNTAVAPGVEQYRLLYLNTQVPTSQPMIVPNPLGTQIPVQPVQVFQQPTQPLSNSQSLTNVSQQPNLASGISLQPSIQGHVVQTQAVSQQPQTIQYQQPQYGQLTMQQLQQQLLHVQGSNIPQQQQFLTQPTHQTPGVPLQQQQQPQIQYAPHVQYISATAQPQQQIQQNPVQLPGTIQQVAPAQVLSHSQLIHQPQTQIYQQPTIQPSPSVYLPQQPQQQSAIIQQSQNVIMQQAQIQNIQRQVHYQPQPSLQQIQQPGLIHSQTTVGHVVPVLHYNQAGNPIHYQPQQQIKVNQPVMSQPMMQPPQPVMSQPMMQPPQPVMNQQPVRLAAQQVQSGNVQRSNSFYSIPHHQTVPPQTNNSNNIIFSRSNSRVDETTTKPLQVVMTGQPAVPMQHATPHSSNTSISSSVSDHDMAGATISPPTSGHILISNGGGDSAILKST